MRDGSDVGFPDGGDDRNPVGAIDTGSTRGGVSSADDVSVTSWIISPFRELPEDASVDPYVMDIPLSLYSFLSASS